MDFKDPKIQKIFLAAAAFLVVAYFWYNRLYIKHDQRLTQMNQEYSRMITDLKNVEMKSKSLDALKLEYEDLLTRYRDIEQLLPEVKMIPSFLVQLHTASSLTGTKIVKIEPLPIQAENFYNVTSYKVEMTGQYHDFGQFISYVANFPFIANLSELKVEAVSVFGGEPTNSKEGYSFGTEKKKSIKASFNISTYFVKDEERLQELAI